MRDVPELCCAGTGVNWEAAAIPFPGSQGVQAGLWLLSLSLLESPGEDTAATLKDVSLLLSTVSSAHCS